MLGQAAAGPTSKHGAPPLEITSKNRQIYGLFSYNEHVNDAWLVGKLKQMCSKMFCNVLCNVVIHKVEAALENDAELEDR